LKNTGKKVNLTYRNKICACINSILTNSPCILQNYLGNHKDNQNGRAIVRVSGPATKLKESFEKYSSQDLYRTTFQYATTLNHIWCLDDGGMRQKAEIRNINTPLWLMALSWEASAMPFRHGLVTVNNSIFSNYYGVDVPMLVLCPVFVLNRCPITIVP
jgi:hypothetical protein